MKRWLWLIGCLSLLPASCTCGARDGRGGSSPLAADGAAKGTGKDAAIDLTSLTGPVEQGWWGRLGKNPKDFGVLTGSSDGWNSLWEGELVQAIDGFRASLAAGEPKGANHHRVGLARAQLELGDFYRSLSDALLDLTQLYLNEREARREKIGPVTPLEMLYKSMVQLLRDGSSNREAAATLTKLSAEPEAGTFGIMGKAWLGLALSLSGDAVEADRNWSVARAAAAADPNINLLIAYLQARAGQWKGEVLPEGDGSMYSRRLRVAALIRTGQLEQATRELASIQFREPDHAVKLSDEAHPGTGAPIAGTGVGLAALEEEKTKLEFYAPYLFEELARLRYLEGLKTLEGLKGPGGCFAYWRGRLQEQLGDREQARAAYLEVKGGGASAPLAGGGTGALAGTGASPADSSSVLSDEDPISCLVLSPMGTVDALAEDARIRLAVFQGTLPANLPTSGWTSKVALLEARARLEPASKAEILEALAFLPEDQRVIEAGLESAITKLVPEQGMTALLRGRFFEHLVHDLYLSKARSARMLGELPLTVKIYDSLHDNTSQDAFSTLNRTGFLFESAMVRLKVDPQGTGVLLNVLWKRIPEVWPASEFVRRIRAFQALENIKSGDVKKGT